MTQTIIPFLLAPFIGLLSCVVMHVVISRSAAGLLRLHSVIVSVGIGLGVTAGMALTFAVRYADWSSSADRWGMAVTWTLAYLCLAYFYILGFYLLGETARRIRLLVELQGAGERGLTWDEMLQVYNARMIVEVRLQRLLAGGQIVERGGRYFIGRPVMFYSAKVLVLLKLMFFGARSEFGPLPPIARSEPNTSRSHMAPASPNE